MISPKSLSFLSLISFVSAATIDVLVGNANGTLAYSPEAISAQPGDQVVFHFQPKNHTVTQSSFADPCGRLDGGFDSGFMPVSDASDSTTFSITVNDTTPVWVYCRQAANTPQSHCGQGMVFAVNCGPDGATNSFTNFKNAALAIGAQLKAEAASSSVIAPSPTAATPAASAPPTTVSAAATTHTVTVGANSELAYSPNKLAAAINDVVVFEFQAKNHTVTQSSFAAPCEKLQFTSNATGFDSGFMPVSADATQFPGFSITVNDTKPIWVYCRQTNPVDHCGNGMVMAINSNETSANTFAAFQSLAMSINGTSANTTSSSTSNSTSSNGASQSQAPSGGAGSQSGTNSSSSGSQSQQPNGAHKLGATISFVLGAIGAVFMLIF